jgi:hypothetical protein
MENQIRGALKATVKDHGNIVDAAWIESAVKRIVGNMRNGSAVKSNFHTEAPRPIFTQR